MQMINLLGTELKIMKTKIKATYVIPSKKEAEEIRKIIQDVENDKTPFSKRKLKRIKRKKN